MNSLGLAVGFGLVTASTLAIASVGLTMQLGITNYVNFAYGDYMTLGAYVAWQANTALHVDIWVAAALATGAMAIFAVGVNGILLTPFARRFEKLFYVVLVTFALSLIMLNAISAVWGAGYRSYRLNHQAPLHIGPFLLTVSQLIIIGIGVVLMFGIHLLLTRTRLGKSMRAMSDNAGLASMCGINTSRITSITWLIAGGCAGLAGSILGLNVTSITPGFGEIYLFVIFSVVILGGIGKAYGAMLGAVVVGLATEISAVLIDPAYKLDVAFGLLVLTLLVRPSGLFASVGKA